MKKTIVIIFILALLATATPVSAEQKVPVGEQISLFGGDQTFPAGEPFHIVHGFGGFVPVQFLGSYDFELEVDGVLRAEDFISRMVEGDDPIFIILSWLHNFPIGMKGAHTFTGHWYAPCQVAVDGGIHPGPCPNPADKVEIFSQSKTVTFE